MNHPKDLIDRLRLIRTPGIGPVTYRQLLLRFGNAEAALAAIPDLARRGGGKAPAIFPSAAAQREMASVEKAGARYLVLGRAFTLGRWLRSKMRRRCSPQREILAS